MENVEQVVTCQGVAYLDINARSWSEMPHEPGNWTLTHELEEKEKKLIAGARSYKEWLHLYDSKNVVVSINQVPQKTSDLFVHLFGLWSFTRFSLCGSFLSWLFDAYFDEQPWAHLLRPEGRYHCRDAGLGLLPREVLKSAHLTEVGSEIASWLAFISYHVKLVKPFWLVEVFRVLLAAIALTWPFHHSSPFHPFSPSKICQACGSLTDCQVVVREETSRRQCFELVGQKYEVLPKHGCHVILQRLIRRYLQLINQFIGSCHRSEFSSFVTFSPEPESVKSSNNSEIMSFFNRKGASLGWRSTSRRWTLEP